MAELPIMGEGTIEVTKAEGPMGAGRGKVECLAPDIPSISSTQTSLPPSSACGGVCFPQAKNQKDIRNVLILTAILPAATQATCKIEAIVYSHETRFSWKFIHKKEKYLTNESVIYY